MKIAIAQMATRAGDLDTTVNRMLGYARSASEQGAQLVVFPMAALTGPVPAELSDQEGFLLDLSEALALLCDEAPCPCIVPVVAEIDGVPAYEALLVRDGDVTPLKTTALLEHDMAGGPDTDGQDAPAPDLPEFEVAGMRFGLAFTYEDLDDYDDFEFDVNAIIFLSGYGYAVDDPSSALGAALSEARFKADVETCGAWMVGVGSVGGYGSQVFSGSSFVLAPWGELAAQAPAYEEALLVCDIDASSEGPLERPLSPQVYDQNLALWGALSLGLSDFVSMVGTNGAALVLDGSLASSLLATLASDALGPTNVHALLASAPDAAAACAELVRSLRIDAVPLARGTLPADDPVLAADLLQAHLASLARSTGALPLSAVDKTALALDDLLARTSAAALAPFGDVYRTDLVELAHLRNTISPVIPAALRDSFDVVDVQGVDKIAASKVQQAEFVDFVLASHVEWGKGLTDVLDAQGHADVALRVLERYAANELSRRLAPPVLLVSSRSLADASKPLGFAWRDRRRERTERPDELALGEFAEALAEAVRKSDNVEIPPSDDMRKTLEFLRDFAQGGGMRPQGFGSADDAGGPGQAPGGFWGSPFSEN